MSISKVTIEDGCTACGLCEDVCPDVFTVDDVSAVNDDADFDEFEDEIRQAAEECPVEVITIAD